jgi:hypothetical protein
MTESPDFRNARMRLNHGVGEMPVLGFGTLIHDAAVTTTATRGALEAGFRHFDCAERYRNEREVGEVLQVGLAAGRIAREDISLPQSCGIPIIVPSVWNRLSRRVLTGSGLTIWISTSFIHRLLSNRGRT